MNFHATVAIYDSLNNLKVNQKENENSGPSNATKKSKLYYFVAIKMKVAHPNNLLKSVVLENPKY